MSIKVFSSACLDLLTHEAKASPRFRQHCNIHSSYSEPCQRLFNAIEPNSYIRPHCHGVESLFAVRGLMALVVFDEYGRIENVERFGQYSNSFKSSLAAGVEIGSGRWHTVISLE